MYINAENDDLSALSKTFDVCIVGAGPAGITLAKSFEGTKYSVCIIESGDFEVDEATQALAAGTVDAPSPDVEENYLSLHSQRRFGGTGTIWGGYCREMEALDFEQRGLPNEHSWPIEKHDIAEFYSRELIDKKQPDRLLKGCDLQLKYFERSTYPFHYIFADEFANSKNITLLARATVIDMSISDVGEVDTIHIVTLNDKRLTIKAQRFVLACGGAGNVKLLLNFNQRYQQNVGNQHDNVGRYFMEHPHFQFYKPPGMLWLANDLAQQVYRDKRYKPCLTLSDDAIRANKLLNFSLLLSAPITNESRWAGSKWYRPQFEHWQDGQDDQTNLDKTGQFFTLSFRVEQIAHRENRITLSKEKDVLGLYNVHLDWKMSSMDSESMFLSLQAITQELGRCGKGRARLILDKQQPWKTMVGGGHMMGTTRMSTKPEDGVVNADCQVHGIKNLFIAGSSVFSTGGFANPTATVMALAARLGEHLKSTLKK